MLKRCDVERLQVKLWNITSREYHTVGCASQLESILQEFPVIQVPVVDVSASTDHSAMLGLRDTTGIRKVHANTPLLIAKSMGKRRKNQTVSIDGIIIHIGRGMKDVAHITALLNIQ